MRWNYLHTVIDADQMVRYVHLENLLRKKLLNINVSTKQKCFKVMKKPNALGLTWKTN